MKKINTTCYFLSLAILFSFMMSCAEAPKQEEKKEETTTPAKEEIVETETMDSDESFILPSPIQIAAIFNRAGLKYEGGLANSPSNLSKYNTKTAKYLNFGIYSADLAYVVLNNQQQESIDYINTVRTLSDEIGMPSVFGSGQLIESFERNISNQDTILRILTTIKRKTDEYLEENSETSKEAIFFAAAWLEGMYLGANSANDKSKLTPRLIEQMSILDNIIRAISGQKDPSLDVSFLIEGLRKIDVTFEGFQEVKSLEDPNTDINDIALTSEELQTLTDQITELRTKIING